MFIITTKLSKGKVLAGVGIAAAVLLGINVAMNLAKDVSVFDAKESASGSSSPSVVSTRVSTGDERVAYLEACGWEVDVDSCTVREVIIPSDFDETYQNYCALQARQGFELEKYKGKRVKQATYTVTNYPTDEEVVANLLIYRGQVIAADISSMLAEGGFTRGITDVPETDSGQTEEKETDKADSTE